MLFSRLNSEAAAEKIRGRGLDVAHPDFSHLFRIEFGLYLYFLTLLSLLVEFHLVQRNVGSDLLLVALVFILRLGKE